MTDRAAFAGLGSPGRARQRVETLLTSHARDWRPLGADSWAVQTADLEWALWQRVAGAREWAERVASVESAEHAHRLAADLALESSR